MFKQTLPEDINEDIKNGKRLSIIDVREDDEVAEGMIPGAKHIRLGDLKSRMNELDKNKEHIIVCRSGGRSTKACEILSKEGFNVVNMVGGMTGWNAKFKK
jgi:rhodanese-related sulfurtransferase